MRDKELGETKELNTKEQFTDRYLKRIKQRLCKRSFCCYYLAQFLKKELFRHRDKSEYLTQSGFALSVTEAVALHSEHCRVLFLNMKNSKVENLWGFVFCSLWRILFPLRLWLLTKPSERLSSGYIRYIVLKQWHMETSTSSELFMLLNVVFNTSAGLRCAV